MGKLAVLASSYTGTSVLTDAVKTAVSNGIADLSATVSDVILLAVPATIGVIALTAGVNYALRKVRGVIAKAS